MKTKKQTAMSFLAVSLLCVVGKTGEAKDSGQPGTKPNDLTVLMENPEAPWDNASLTTFGHKNYGVRSERYRYIVYADGTEELYDHEKDQWEWHNLADSPEYAEIKEELRKGLPAHHEPSGN